MHPLSRLNRNHNPCFGKGNRAAHYPHSEPFFQQHSQIPDASPVFPYTFQAVYGVFCGGALFSVRFLPRSFIFECELVPRVCRNSEEMFVSNASLLGASRAPFRRRKHRLGSRGMEIHSSSSGAFEVAHREAPSFSTTRTRCPSVRS